MRVRPCFKSISAVFTHAQRDSWTIPMTRQMGFEPAPSFLHDSVDELVAEMRDSGVVHALVPGNIAVAPESAGGGATAEKVDDHDIFELTHSYGDVFFGAVPVAPWDERTAIHAERAITQWGFRALTVDPGQAVTPRYPDDLEIRWTYELAESLSVPVLVKLSHQVGPDLTYGHPERLGRVASAFPTVTFVMVHGGWPRVRDALAVASRHANVYLQPDFYLTYPGRQDYVDAANTFLQDRMLFASAYPVMPVVGMTELLRSLPFHEQSRRKVAYDNAARLLGL